MRLTPQNIRKYSVAVYPSDADKIDIAIGAISSSEVLDVYAKSKKEAEQIAKKSYNCERVNSLQFIPRLVM